CIFECQRSGNMECHLRRVDLMVRSVVYVRMNAYYRESSQNTSFHSFLDTFAYSRDVFLRNCTADNRRLEFECLFSVDIHRLKFNFTVSVLSTSTRLFCVLAVHIHRFGDGLFVCYLRCTYVCLYLELTKQT